MSSAPIDLFTRLARKGARLNAEPKGWDHAILLRFWRVEGDSLVLKVEAGLSEDEEEALQPGLPIWAVFENMGRVRTFDAEILEVVRPDEGPVAGIRCTLPDKVQAEDRRKAFRVPRIPPFALRATLVSGEREWTCTVSNLSVLGALLVFPEGVAESLQDEAPYKLELETFEANAAIGCRFARRTRTGKIAVRFPSSLRMGEVSPPPDLAKVVRLCELIWLRKRQGTEKKAQNAA